MNPKLMIIDALRVSAHEYTAVGAPMWQDYEDIAQFGMGFNVGPMVDWSTGYWERPPSGAPSPDEYVCTGKRRPPTASELEYTLPGPRRWR